MNADPMKRLCQVNKLTFAELVWQSCLHTSFFTFGELLNCFGNPACTPPFFTFGELLNSFGNPALRENYRNCCGGECQRNINAAKKIKTSKIPFTR